MLFDIDKKQGSMIKVVGVGGGGSNAVTHMFQQGIVGVDFVICNTDNQALERSPVTTKIQLGPNLTSGMGAGNIPEKGKQACIESIDDVRRFLEDDTRMLFITAGLGGGTGTGAAPIIAKVAQELNILTIAIVTLPFTFEGRKRKAQALEGLDELKKNVDSIIVIGNDKLRGVHATKTLSEAFGHADDVLTTAAKGIAEIITVSGQVNVDFQDVYTVMKDSGVAIMGSGTASGEDRALRAIQEALSSQLIEDNDIRGSKNILLNISSGREEVTLQEMYQITEHIQELAGYGTDIIWGHCHDESLEEQLVVTVIATGFEHSSRGLKQPKEKITLTLDDDMDEPMVVDNLDPIIKEETDRINPIMEPNAKTEENPAPQSNTIELEIDGPGLKSTKYSYDTPYRSREEIEAEKQANQERIEAKKRQIEERRRQSTQYGSPDYNNLIDKEKIPAYKRRNVQLDPVGPAGENNMSKWTVSLDDEEPIIRKNGNSFIHDKAD